MAEDNDRVWFDGFFDIQWVGDDELPCERFDFNVSDGGLLSLRDKKRGEVHIYAPHTWHHIEANVYSDDDSPFVNRH